MAEELKACPFCSCTDIGEVTINPRLEPRHRRFKVYCKVCQCRTSEHKTRKEARMYWNTRAQLPSQGGEAVAWLYTGDYLRSTTYGEYRFSGIQVEKWGTYCSVHLDPDRTINGGKIRNALVTPLYTHPADQVAEPDAELVRQCIAQELATWEGDFKGPVHTAMRCLQVRIDAKMASLKGVEE